MPEVMQLATPIETAARRVEHVNPAIRTDAVYVVFTTIDATLEAARVASALAKSMAVPLTLIHFRLLPDSRSANVPTAVSPLETDALVERLRKDDVDVRLRIYLCRNERGAFPMAFQRRSIIVIGGTRGWLGGGERLRRQLEGAGHFVLLVDPRLHQEHPHA